MELMQAVEEFVLGLAGSPWILLAVTVLATIDGFFPPVPSESIVIAVAALAVEGDAPSLWFLVLAAAVGAFSGDLIAYTIGTKVPIDDLRVLRGRRGQAGVARAKRALAKRGTVYILSARFIPIGRVAVNMTAGAVGFPRKRFIGIAAVAAVVWGSYSTLMGLGAGKIFHENPLVAVAVGVAGGVLAGVVVDKLLGAIQRRWFPDVPPPAVRMHVEDDGDADAGEAAAAAGPGATDAARDDAPTRAEGGERSTTTSGGSGTAAAATEDGGAVERAPAKPAGPGSPLSSAGTSTAGDGVTQPRA